MQPRHSELLAAAVLRPLAEQLLESMSLQPGMTVCELMCDGGVLSRDIAEAIGRDGTLFTTDTERALASGVAAENEHRCTTRGLLLEAGRIPLDDQSCDVVTSLITIACADWRGLMDDARRVLRSGGVLTLCVWNPESPPRHEVLFRDALREASVTHAPCECLLAPVDAPAGATVRTIHDVARLHTATHVWAAMCSRLGDTPRDVEHAARAAYEDALAPYEAQDGSLAVPLSAQLISATKEALSGR